MDGAAAVPGHTRRRGHLNRLGHVPALDGLRGVAVAAVLLFHGGVSWAPGGFLGVDVFFVLSGFLITTLLLEERGATGRISLRAFWTRRARRLVPALLVTAVTVVVAAPWIAEARSATSIRLDAAAALAYVANWRFILTDTAYFDRTAGPSPLEHTWSLGVEEQFYVAWPVVAVLLVRGAPWRLGAVAVGGAVASIGAMALTFSPGSDTSRAYFGTDSRVHVVLLGCALAVVIAALRRRERVDGWTRAAVGLGAASGAVLLGGAFGTAGGDTDWLYEGGFALVAVGTAFVIAEVVLVPGGIASMALAAWPLRALGVVSYGAYLWHWPVFLYLTASRTGLTGGALLGVRVAATLAIAVASFAVVETPIRRGAVLRGLRAGVVLPLLAAMVAGGLAIDAARLSSTDPGVAASTPPVPPPLPVAPGEELRVLVVGDSVAQTLALWIRNDAARAGIDVTDHAVLGCGIARGGPYRYFGSIDDQPPQCEDWPAQWSAVVDEVQPHVVLLVVGRWEVMDRVHRGVWTHIGERTYDRYLRQELEEAVAVLTSTGARLAMATAPYYRRGERPDGGIWPEDEEPRVDRFNELVRAVAADHRGIVTVLELNDRTTSTPGEYARDVDGVRLRTDGVHFGRAAGRFLAPWLLPQLRALVA